MTKFISKSDAEDQFDDFLDEVNEDIHIGNLTYTTSQVLKEVDPIAYREEFLNWLDAENLTTDEDEADEDEDEE